MDYSGNLDGQTYSETTSIISTKIEATTTTTALADHYFEVGFTSGNLESNGNLFVNTRLTKSDWSNFTFSNDYSSYPDSQITGSENHIVVLLNNNVIQGTLPTESDESNDETDESNDETDESNDETDESNDETDESNDETDESNDETDESNIE